MESHDSCSPDIAQTNTEGGLAGPPPELPYEFGAVERHQHVSQLCQIIGSQFSFELGVDARDALAQDPPNGLTPIRELDPT